MSGVATIPLGRLSQPSQYPRADRSEVGRHSPHLYEDRADGRCQFLNIYDISLD
jgi:hypothetical protein